MKDAELISLLVEIGFNQIEANVYLALLKESPLTGYKIASQTTKSRSNVYQALKSLEQKGAVVELQANRSKQFKAVAIELVLQQKEREFQSKKETISTAFHNLKQTEDDDVIYKLNTVSQVYAKSIEMIRKAEKIIFLDAQLLQLSQIDSALQEVAARGVKVAVLGSSKYPLTGCEVFEFQPYAPEGKTYDPWPINWYCLAVDGREFLIATFRENNEDLIYAIWSNNSYITGWIFSDMLYEIAFNNIIRMFQSGLTREEIWQGINDYAAKYFYEAPGINELKEKWKNG